MICLLQKKCSILKPYVLFMERKIKDLTAEERKKTDEHRADSLEGMLVLKGYPLLDRWQNV